jgi:hypothetical protein
MDNVVKEINQIFNYIKLKHKYKLLKIINNFVNV